MFLHIFTCIDTERERERQRWCVSHYLFDKGLSLFLRKACNLTIIIDMMYIQIAFVEHYCFLFDMIIFVV